MTYTAKAKEWVILYESTLNDNLLHYVQWDSLSKQEKRVMPYPPTRGWQHFGPPRTRSDAERHERWVHRRFGRRTQIVHIATSRATLLLLNG